MEQNKRSFILIAPSTSQSRFHKRAIQLQKIGNVHVFAFKREYYNENSFPVGIPFHSLGKITDGKYLLRIISIIRAVILITREIPKKNRDVFYSLSIDCLIIGRICRFKKGVYEVGDLIYTSKNRAAFLAIEKIVLRGINALVLTSRFFYDDFYKQLNLVPEHRFLVLDNKVNTYFVGKRLSTKKLNKDKIVFGLVGLFRFKKPIELLLNYVERRKETHELECYGDGPFRHLIESSVCDNIHYHGSFKNPEGLYNIYNSIDLNYVVYDNQDKNVQLAIPNKLFESAFFGVPILCGENTALGTLSASWGIGGLVSIKNQETFDFEIDNITYPWILEKSNNCLKIPEKKLIDDGDRRIFDLLELL